MQSTEESEMMSNDGIERHQDKWNQKSTVRRKEIPTGEFSDDSDPFPRDLLAIIKHPAIAQKEKLARKILGYGLCKTLYSQKRLELEFVGPILMDFSLGRLVELPLEQQWEATNFAVDEPFHVVVADRLMYNAQNHFELKPSITKQTPRFVKSLKKLGHDRKLPPELMKLAVVLMAETIQSDVLFQVPKNPQVDPLVRVVFQDHAEDEVSHGKFFRRVFPEIWHSVPPREQEKFGSILAPILTSLFSPDIELEYKVLRDVGFTPKQARAILEETHSDSKAVSEAARKSSIKTIKMLDATGILAIPAVADSFTSEGLIS